MRAFRWFVVGVWSTVLTAWLLRCAVREPHEPASEPEPEPEPELATWVEVAPGLRCAHVVVPAPPKYPRLLTCCYMGAQLSCVP